MGSHWLMATSANLNARWAEIARIGADPLQRYPMKMQELRWSQPEWPIWMVEILHHLYYRIVLTEPI